MPDIHITIPRDNLPERRYCLEILFKEFLGLDYRLSYGSTNYVIVVNNHHTIEIEDHFFNNHPAPLSYLSIDNIPGDPLERALHLEGIEVPVIYGKPSIEQLNDKVFCHIDIFASVFFMLTRWEETLIKDYDSHGRSLASSSLAYKQGFLDIPVVDYYLEILRDLLKRAGVRGDQMLSGLAELNITHDVDHLFRLDTLEGTIRTVAGDVLHRKSLSKVALTLINKLRLSLSRGKDPWDCYDSFMDSSESLGVVSTFYFIASGNTKYDNLGAPRYRIDSHATKGVIDNIVSRGHKIGLHASYDAYNDEDMFSREKLALEAASGHEITDSRNHFLRFSSQESWLTANNCGIITDSTCGYAEMPGFRCGTGRTFSVFNILSQKKLVLKERPLIYMDSSGFSYLNLNSSEAEELALRLFHVSGGNYTLLWHNSFGYLESFRKIISEIREHQS